MDIKSILESLGYKLSNHGNYFKTSRVWCGGDNPGAITIYPKSNRIIDHVEGNIYNLESFLKFVLKKDENQFKEWLDNNKYQLPKVELNSNIKLTTLIDFDLNNLLPVYDYWIDRGISENVLKSFNCGLCKVGIMKDRFTFIIQNGKKDIIGVVGRDVTNKKRIKWKVCGVKSEFVFNALLNHSLINTKKEVILIESIGDGLSLSMSGIDNWLCLFGVELQLGILNYLIKINPQKIIISTNNDKLDGGKAGNLAAEKIYKKLSKYFDSSILEIKLPQSANDWNEVLVKFDKNKIIEEFNQKV
jgi:hypothetical protein